MKKKNILCVNTYHPNFHVRITPQPGCFVEVRMSVPKGWPVTVWWLLCQAGPVFEWSMLSCHLPGFCWCHVLCAV